MKYETMYKRAINKIQDGTYKGYEGVNAYIMYVYNKYGVNAAANSSAHDALCEVLKEENC